MSEETRRRVVLVAFALVAFAFLLGFEVATEEEDLDLLDLLQEATQIGLIVAVAASVSLFAGRLQRQHEEKLALIRDLETARAEGEGWRSQVQSHLDGLGAAIERQFEQWSLTGAEREVGLLMLKGFVHKEVAALRGTTEATIRQQARSIYQKSGLDSRAAFCAYFLEDLLPPGALGDGRPPP
jgi:DNA-binding NarL/FixJ family response regulator